MKVGIAIDNSVVVPGLWAEITLNSRARNNLRVVSEGYLRTPTNRKGEYSRINFEKSRSGIDCLPDIWDNAKDGENYTFSILLDSHGCLTF